MNSTASRSAVPAGVGRDIARFLLHLGTGVFHGNREACGAHGGKVDDVVADKGGFVLLDSLLFNDFFNARALVLNSLTNVFESQIAGAKGDGLRDALGDKSGLNAAESRERDRGTVV